MAFSAAALEAINQPEREYVESNVAALKAMGGSAGLLKTLKTTSGGRPKADADEDARRAAFGSNSMPEPEAKTWLELFVEAFDDTTVLILCAAAVVSLGVGLYDDHRRAAAGLPVEGGGGWVEGVAIIAAVLIVAVVTATNDFSKEQQFRALSTINDDISVKVLRGGAVGEASTTTLLVGDVVKLEAGDKVPADCVLLGGGMGGGVQCNESALTGEPDDKPKGAADPFLLSGTEVTAGAGSALVVAVGAASQWGRIRAKLVKEESNTPLQDKLDTLAEQIGYVGMAAATLTFVAMMAVWYGDAANPARASMFDTVLDAFIIGVTIVVVAVPEGLPLAVTISLAYSTMKMLADNNLIRVLAACETMGNATTICSDKTGTLTQNRMTVVQAFLAGDLLDTDPAAGFTRMAGAAREVLGMGLSLNTTATLSEEMHVDGKPKVIGNKTEGALLLFLQDAGVDVAKARTSGLDEALDTLFPFSSSKKRASVLVAQPGKGGGRRFLTKGAAEDIVGCCSRQLLATGEVVALGPGDKKKALAQVAEWARQSFRVIALAHKDLAAQDLAIPRACDEEALHEGLVLDGLLAIQDPLRPEVPGAVATCQAAGIMVRMVTGDNLDTAVAIAKECGILTPGGKALTGAEFRAMTPAQLDAALPTLQVLARSSPEDKFLLVTRLNGEGLPEGQEAWEKAHPGRDWARDAALLLPGHRGEWEAARAEGLGEVVGVTGDGTNDGPALRAAEVGLSMGLSGTDVAKEASDIIIMDDNFNSIVKAVMWGRCVFDNIRKFLQFQLTVNVVALISTFLAAVLGSEPPLNAVMMLWVNLIMDTMGALALGTELPTEGLLQRKPYKRNASLISRVMWRHVLVQSTYQMVVTLVLLQHGELLFEGVAAGSRVHFTLIFNFFVFCQVFNELNARSIGDDANVLRGLGGNGMFLAVVAFTVVAQVGIVELGGDFTKTAHLTSEQWARTVGAAIVTLPLGVLMRMVPVSEDPNDFALPSCGSIRVQPEAPPTPPPTRRETRSSTKKSN